MALSNIPATRPQKGDPRPNGSMPLIVINKVTIATSRPAIPATDSCSEFANAGSKAKPAIVAITAGGSISNRSIIGMVNTAAVI